MIPKYAIAARNLTHLYTLGSVNEVGRRNFNQIVAIWSAAGLGGKSKEIQVWVRPTYTAYREGWKTAWKEAWEEALKRKLIKEEKGLIIEPGYEIDHIFPKSWAQKYGYDWVRLTMLPSIINRKWSDTLTELRHPIPDICYCDDAGWSKWLMQNP